MRKSPATPYHTVSYPLPLGFNGRLAGVYRWWSGRPMNGHRYTDATGWRYGTMATDLSGKATAYQLLPGYKRVLYVRLPLMLTAPAAGLCLAGYAAHVALTAAVAVTLAVPGLARLWRTRRFRRDVIEPVGAAVANVLRSRNVAGMAHTWIHVPADFRDDPDAKIKIRLPMDWIGEKGDRARLAEVVSTRLQVDDLSPSWSVHSGAPFVQFSVPPRPPTAVDFLDALAAADGAGPDDLVMGLGARDRVESFSLDLESPHLLIAGGTGAGKSELLAWLVGQFMRRGYGVAVLDAKFTSHMWLRRVPGVLYASESSELHDALIWLDGELLRRARFVATGGNPDTLVPMVVLAEEMNGASNRLRQYWGSIKGPGDPQMSPALTAMGNLSSMGRELRMHILMAGQSMTAKAVGGPENRENFGGRAFARATGAQWRMLAPQIKPAPIKRGAPGRWHLVVGDTLREFQVPFVDLKGKKTPGAEARLIEWATGGRAGPDVVAMMAGFVPGVVVTQSQVQSRRSDGVTTLREYASEYGLNLGALRMRVNRAGLESVGLEGTAGLYLAAELEALAPAQSPT